MRLESMLDARLAIEAQRAVHRPLYEESDMVEHLERLQIKTYTYVLGNCLIGDLSANKDLFAISSLITERGVGGFARVPPRFFLLPFRHIHLDLFEGLTKQFRWIF